MSNRQQSLDLLNSVHAFPTRVPIKVIGANAAEFVVRVVTAVRLEIRAEEDPPYSTRHTPQGRHVSITLEPHFESAEQVLAVYDCLRAVEGIVMLM